jgi:hypothetical protein
MVRRDGMDQHATYYRVLRDAGFRGVDVRKWCYPRALGATFYNYLLDLRTDLSEGRGWIRAVVEIDGQNRMPLDWLLALLADHHIPLNPDSSVLICDLMRLAGDGTPPGMLQYSLTYAEAVSWVRAHLSAAEPKEE